MSKRIFTSLAFLAAFPLFVTTISAANKKTSKMTVVAPKPAVNKNCKPVSAPMHKNIKEENGLILGGEFTIEASNPEYFELGNLEYKVSNATGTSSNNIATGLFRNDDGTEDTTNKRIGSIRNKKNSIIPHNLVVTPQLAAKVGININDDIKIHGHLGANISLNDAKTEAMFNYKFSDLVDTTIIGTGGISEAPTFDDMKRITKLEKHAFGLYGQVEVIMYNDIKIGAFVNAKYIGKEKLDISYTGKIKNNAAGVAETYYAGFGIGNKPVNGSNVTFKYLNKDTAWIWTIGAIIAKNFKMNDIVGLEVFGKFGWSLSKDIKFTGVEGFNDVAENNTTTSINYTKATSTYTTKVGSPYISAGIKINFDLFANKR